jgi:hypothetical protein
MSTEGTLLLAWSQGLPRYFHVWCLLEYKFVLGCSSPIPCPVNMHCEIRRGEESRLQIRLMAKHTYVGFESSLRKQIFEKDV